ncbi:hypothetical protein [Thermomonas haemolytica]|uniref:Uncharacterized protein n=1 Tax=Thermomonas haemolytica TaxID=141949 RepID=A0A4R3N9N2_9GAMM|nr:hypothetical protein [Thermomonas haemolytica]TCT25272.1 hypothetical protein EDC34_102160 [Thermomonas haemolytica]TNY29940.1 hypothetical protein BV505_02795 [Thermomonas haemolytica]
MRKLNDTQDRAQELMGELGDGLRKALPGSAKQWLETGAALAAVRAGTKVAGGFVRRNPLLVGAAVAGAGLLWYAARQRARRQAALEGQARQVRALRRGEYEQDDYGV